MKLKIIILEAIHNNEYTPFGVKEIIAVDFFDGKRNFATENVRMARLICRMED